MSTSRTPPIAELTLTSRMRKACDAGDLPSIVACLDEGISPSVLFDDGLMPLHVCARGGKLQGCTVLVEHGADINATDALNKRPLDYAAPNQIGMSIALIEMGAQLEAASKQAGQLLAVLCTDGNDQDGGETGLRRLLEHGVSPSSVNKDGIPVLHLVAKRGMLAWCQALYDFGADINAHSNGNTALHSAAFHGKVESIDWLVSRGADVNAVNDAQRVPLHHAVKMRQINAFLRLLELGADFGIEPGGTRSPLGDAMANGLSKPVMACLALSQDFAAPLERLRDMKAEGLGRDITLPATRLEAGLRSGYPPVLVRALQRLQEEGVAALVLLQQDVRQSFEQLAADPSLVAYVRRGGVEEMRRIVDPWVAQHSARLALQDMLGLPPNGTPRIGP